MYDDITPQLARAVDGRHVAIDGPAGSGKSSVARRVAERLGAAHIDTGAMYRALTLFAQREAIRADDGPALAARLARLSLSFDGGELLLEGAPAGDSIRSAAVEAEVSTVAAHAEVRSAMQRRQRELTWEARGATVMEGRDIGSVVLPLARCKIYLDASVAERARRRAAQSGRGTDPEALAEVERDLAERDRKDTERKESPLRISPDAHVLDTTDLDLDGVVERCVVLARASEPTSVDPDQLARDFGFRDPHYRRFWAFARGLMRRLFAIEFLGTAHQDVPEGVIFACNHVAWWDPPLLGIGMHRQVHFMAKKELFVGPFGAFLRHYGVIPLVRGRYDAKAFDFTRNALRRGDAVAIFPEGTRKPIGRPGPMKRGLGILALEAGVPYIPCFVRGTTRSLAATFQRKPLELWMGPAVRLHALPTLRERGLSDAELQSRVGELFLAQIHAFRHRAERHRSRPDEA